MIFITMLIAGAAGCSPDRAARDLLDRADSLMESRPDSALALLDSIDAGAISDRSTRARYALLMSQALDKNYIDVTSDSLISIATRYYADVDNSPELMKSLFYQATVYYNDGSYDHAAVDATHAYEIAVKLNDHFWTGKTATLIADIFNLTYNYDESLKFRKVAVDAYAKTNKESLHRWTLLGLSMDYINIRDHEKAFSIIDSLQKLDKHTVTDSAFTDNLIRTCFEYNLENRDYQTAKTYFNKLKNYNFQELSAIDYGNIGYVEANLGNSMLAKQYIDSARKYSKQDDAKDLFAIDIANWEYLKSNGTKYDIIDYSEKIMHTQNAIVKKNAWSVGIRSPTKFL